MVKAYTIEQCREKDITPSFWIGLKADNKVATYYFETINEAYAFQRAFRNIEGTKISPIHSLTFAPMTLAI